MILKTSLDNIPHQGLELTVPSGKLFGAIDQWLQSGGLKVGVCWSGNAAHTNDHNRSLSFDEFSVILEDLPQAVCLQKDIRDSDRAAVDACPSLVTVCEHLTDMSATAALISQLDVVITVDTSVAHLAAALGKPTWILVAMRADFRWMLSGDESPWYPSVRLLRQQTAGDWSDVLRGIRSRLSAASIGSRQVMDALDAPQAYMLADASTG